MPLPIFRSSTKRRPDRIVLYSVEGWGKSTWAAGSNAPLFANTEDGLGHLDVPAVLCDEDYDQTLRVIREFPVKEYKTLVIDTIDALEVMLQRKVCVDKGWSDIEAPGYGKGYTAALDEWSVFLGELDKLRERGVEIILLSHSHVKIFNNPSGPDYSRFQLKVNEKAAALIKGWADQVFFGTYEEQVKKANEKDTKGKVVSFSDSARIIHTIHAPAWDAKNRLALPKVLKPCTYADFSKARALFLDKNASAPAPKKPAEPAPQKSTIIKPVDVPPVETPKPEPSAETKPAADPVTISKAEMDSCIKEFMSATGASGEEVKTFYPDGVKKFGDLKPGHYVAVVEQMMEAYAKRDKTPGELCNKLFERVNNTAADLQAALDS